MVSKISAELLRSKITHMNKSLRINHLSINVGKVLALSIRNSREKRPGCITRSTDTFFTKLSNLGCWTKLPLGRERTDGKDGIYRYLFSSLRSNSLLEKLLCLS